MSALDETLGPLVRAPAGLHCGHRANGEECVLKKGHADLCRNERAAWVGNDPELDRERTKADKRAREFERWKKKHPEEYAALTAAKPKDSPR